MNKNRNYGIDLLRIITMIGICSLHILGHGGVLSSAVRAAQFDTAWLMEVIGYPAVDCFVIISGFVGCRKVLPSLKSVVTQYLTVLLYSVTVFMVLTRFFPETVPMSDLGGTFMPVTTYQYWFFTCYIGMLVLSPLINGFANHADKKTLYIVGTVIFLVFAVYGSYSIHQSDRFRLANGYSVIWFVAMYALGAIISKTEFYKKIPVYVAAPGLALCFISTWLVKINSVGADTTLVPLSKSLVNYVSPTMVLAAIFSVCLFAKLKINRKFIARLITFFSSSAFSVYLIHDNNYFRDNIIVGAFKKVGDYEPVLLVLTVLANALCIFIACVLIDKVRVLLFKLLHIEKLCDLIQNADFKKFYYKFTGDKNIPAVIKKGRFSTPVWIQQLWQDGKYAEFVRKNGCGHCCTTMALNLHGVKINPHQEFELCREMWGEPKEDEDNFLSVSGIVKVLKHFDVKAEAFGVADAKKSANHIYNELKDGNMAVFWSKPSERLSPNPFSPRGHYVLAVEITDLGIVIANSSNSALTQDGIQIVDLSVIEKSLFLDSDPQDFTWGKAPFEHSGGYVIIKK